MPLLHASSLGQPVGSIDRESKINHTVLGSINSSIPKTVPSSAAIVNSTSSVSYLTSKTPLAIKRVAIDSQRPCYFKWLNTTSKFECVHLPSVLVKAHPNLPISTAAPSFAWSSQAQQDQIVHELLGGKSGGYFVDLAANDWKDLSNTYALERYFGWKGLCIEPNPYYLQGLLENRACTTVVNPVSNVTGDAVTFAFKGPTGGIVSNETDLKPEFTRGSPNKLITVTLTLVLDALRAPRIIDYLSLDVEGAENWVLQGLNFKKYSIKVVSVERPSEYVHKILTEKGFRWLTQGKPPSVLYGECIYVHSSLQVTEEFFDKFKHQRVTEWGVNHVRGFHDYLLTPEWGKATSLNTRAN